MERFLGRHRDRVIGTLSGFDRLLFRGSLRSVSYIQGLEIFLSSQHVLHKDFKYFVEKVSSRIKEHARGLAEELGRPFQYLASSSSSKEEIAQEIMERDGISKGLVCVFSCVEPCQSYCLYRDKENKELVLKPAERKCLHLYFYYVDRQFGLMHVRLESWLPLTIQVCLNGREYLARRLREAGIGFEQRDNCFTHIDDLAQAQAMLDELTQYRWVPFLNALARRVNPWIDPESGFDLHGYYWSLRQGEYATDVMFRDQQALKEVYPGLVSHAMQHFSCRDVLRFLGRGTNSRFSGNVSSDIKSRPEGIRIKHRVEENSIKMYDKQGSILRIETAINNPRRFKVRRQVTRQGQSCIGWVPMRKGVADIARRVEISRAANERYLEALAVVERPAPTSTVLDPVSRRVVRDGRAYRGLRPITQQETVLFQAALRGEHLLQGFRNQDIRRALNTPAVENDPLRRRQASAQVTRYLRLLRAHRLIRKVSGTRYYRVTEKGHHVMTTALKLREIDVSKLAA